MSSVGFLGRALDGHSMVSDLSFNEVFENDKEIARDVLMGLDQGRIDMIDQFFQKNIRAQAHRIEETPTRDGGIVGMEFSRDKLRATIYAIPPGKLLPHYYLISKTANGLIENESASRFVEDQKQWKQPEKIDSKTPLPVLVKKEEGPLPKKPTAKRVDPKENEVHPPSPPNSQELSHQNSALNEAVGRIRVPIPAKALKKNPQASVDNCSCSSSERSCIIM